MSTSFIYTPQAQYARADYEMRLAGAVIRHGTGAQSDREKDLLAALQEALAEMKIAKAGLIGHARAVLEIAIIRAAEALEKAGAP